LTSQFSNFDAEANASTGNPASVSVGSAAFLELANASSCPHPWAKQAQHDLTKGLSSWQAAPCEPSLEPG
jgi:hypothetical protein